MRRRGLALGVPAALQRTIRAAVSSSPVVALPV
jgi:hypothetical protein